MVTMAPTRVNQDSDVFPTDLEGTGEKPLRPTNGLPPLEVGDHLNRVEFERRYQAMPHVKKAELVEGVVYMPSPARHQQHARPNALAVGWLLAYAAKTPGTDFADNGTLRLDYDNEVQPDAALFLREDRGGRCRQTTDDYLEGPPELIVEIAASSASYDLHSKQHVYRRNGVREYLVFLATEREVVWYFLAAGHYERLVSDGEGILRSRVFPGLWLHPEHFWNGDLPGLLEVLQQGLASQEHGDFVAELETHTPL
jgi:Uma2 family endonuclease